MNEQKVASTEITAFMNYSLIRSKTFWTIVVMAVVGAGNALLPMIPPAYAATVELLLGVLASAFHLSTGQSTSGAN